ncbi:arylsulfatase B [Flavisolibacter nicotianae]|uniref:arylsulfatase B n=1 Tax=Flavisolibacter nicotianae TaxID=2364882 RepID=UPI000EAC2F4C|nr:arylsulfatase [Flavisolibacter nicotianae]
MNPRPFLLLLFFALGFGWLCAGAQSAKHPNIVFILADDLGWGDVGFHGSEIKTPNLDRLAAEGVVLSRYYTAPICSPTRAGLMTGRYPNRFGLRATVVPPWSQFGVDTTEEFLPQMLQQAGYANRAVIGKWHLGQAKRRYLPLQRGFTHFYGHYNGAINYFTHEREGELDWHNDEETSYDKGYSTDLLTDEAVRCIQSYSKQGAPFFVYVAYNAPHGPLQAKKEDLQLYGFDESKPLFGKNGSIGEIDKADEGRGNSQRQTYSAMVNCMDRGIGRILQALKEQGLEENTLVIFHSDNGAAPNEGGTSGELRGLKFQEWEGGVRAPAIVRWPGGFRGGRTVDGVMGYVDLAPTLREITGLHSAPAKPYDGVSMLAAWKGQKTKKNRELYLGYGSIISNNWKLVKANAGNPKMEATEDLLFDIVKDPSEKNNVKAAHPDVYAELLEKVAAYDAIKPAVEVPPYGQGRKGYKAPREWKITEE